MSEITRYIKLEDELVLKKWQEVVEIKKELQPEIERHEEIENEIKKLSEEKQEIEKKINTELVKIQRVTNKLAPILDKKFSSGLDEFEVIDSIEDKDGEMVLVINSRLESWKDAFRKKKEQDSKAKDVTENQQESDETTEK